MKQTPLSKAIAEIEAEMKIWESQIPSPVRGALLRSRQILQSLLPYERECIEGAYDAGIATTSGMQTSDFKCGTKYYSQTFNQNNPQGGGGE